MLSKNGRRISSASEIFERHAQRGDGCWPWSGYRNESGYGFTRVGGRGSKGVFAHRLSWELHNGPIPDGMHVLHRCDNPACVRPDHLFIGTNLDNIRDRMSKGRKGGGCTVSGNGHHNTKHSDELVARMRAERAAGRRVVDISKDYGIQRDYLSRILTGAQRSQNC